MKIIIKGLHLNITDPIKDYARKKAEKLEKFFNNIQNIHIDLDILNKTDASNNHLASGTISAAGKFIKAKTESGSIYASIDLLMEKLSIQLKKHKEKTNSHTKSKKQSRKIKKTSLLKRKKLFIPKPISVEDAVLLCESKKLPLLVFNNFDTNSINVIYPTDDNQIILIETK